MILLMRDSSRQFKMEWKPSLAKWWIVRMSCRQPGKTTQKAAPSVVTPGGGLRLKTSHRASTLNRISARGKVAEADATHGSTRALTTRTHGHEQRRDPNFLTQLATLGWHDQTPIRLRNEFDSQMRKLCPASTETTSPSAHTVRIHVFLTVN